MRMNPVKGLMAIDWSGRKLRAWDAGLGIAVAAAGLYLEMQILFWIGAAGIVFALINPMGMIQRGIGGFIRKKD